MGRPRATGAVMLVCSLALAPAGCSSDEPPPQPDGVPAGSETGGTTGDGSNQGGTTENPVPPSQPGVTTP